MSNANLIEFFKNIASAYRSSNEIHRAYAYSKAADIISSLNYIITPENAKNLIKIRGIGPKILTNVQEFLATGSSQTARELNLNDLDKIRTIELLKTVHGISDVKALQFYNLGVRTIENLKGFNHPPAITLYLEYYEDLQMRIPRFEAELYNQIFQTILNHYHIEGELAGSYRRGRADLGDLDLLIKKSDPDFTLNFLKNILIDNKIMLGVLAEGQYKILSIVKIDGYPARRLDILMVEPDEYALSLMYFTGSKNFNKIVRQRALELGYTMNEHRLLRSVDGVEIKGFKTEEEIFNYLKMDYVSPEERNL